MDAVGKPQMFCQKRSPCRYALIEDAWTSLFCCRYATKRMIWLWVKGGSIFCPIVLATSLATFMPVWYPACVSVVLLRAIASRIVFLMLLRSGVSGRSPIGSCDCSMIGVIFVVYFWVRKSFLGEFVVIGAEDFLRFFGVTGLGLFCVASFVKDFPEALTKVLSWPALLLPAIVTCRD